MLQSDNANALRDRATTTHSFVIAPVSSAKSCQNQAPRPRVRAAAHTLFS